MFQLRKFGGTLRLAYRLVMARTFGEYVHSICGPEQPDIVVYKWSGATWWIPTAALEGKDSNALS